MSRQTGIKLAVFDLDGTLTRSGTNVLCHVGRAFGFQAQAERLSALYAHGRRSNKHVTRIAAKRLRGRSHAELQEALETLPMVDGIGETVGFLHRRRVSCSIATITFDFAADYVARRFGFEQVLATTLAWTPDRRLTGGVKTVLEGRDKACFIERQCARLGISFSDVLVVGDALSDIPAMEMAGMSIAFNAVPEIEDLASVAVRSDDLRDVVPPIRHLLNESS